MNEFLVAISKIPKKSTEAYTLYTVFIMIKILKWIKNMWEPNKIMKNIGIVVFNTECQEIRWMLSLLTFKLI